MIKLSLYGYPYNHLFKQLKLLDTYRMLKIVTNIFKHMDTTIIILQIIILRIFLSYFKYFRLYYFKFERYILNYMGIYKKRMSRFKTR